MPLALQRLWIQITSDKRRFGLLVVVFAVALLMWARLIIISKPPRTAMANEKQQPTTDTESADGDAPSDKPPVAPMPVDLAVTAARDPFRISPEYFPKPTFVAAPDEVGTKSLQKQAEDAKQAEARLTAQLRAMVDRMKLEAVMKGVNVVVIDGRTFRIGEEIPAGGDGRVRFKLTEILARSVILEAENRQFELRMAQAGDEAP